MQVDLWVMILLVFGFVGVTLVRENVEQAESWWDFFFSSLPSSLLQGWQGFTQGEVNGVEYRTSGSWLTAFALAFTSMILITGYTAVVTTTLLTSSNVDILSLDDGVSKGATFCVNPDMASGLVAKYPKLGALLVDAPGSSHLDKMDQGKCTAAIVFEERWRRGRDRTCRLQADEPHPSRS